MSQNQATVAYPPPPTSTFPGAYSAPPPAGYPTMDEQSNQQNRVPVETKSRGDGFWKCCCQALCCIASLGSGSGPGS